MALKTTPWDSAEYLKTEAEMAAYLQACFEEAPDVRPSSSMRWALSRVPAT